VLGLQVVQLFNTPPLTPSRVRLAYAIAAATDLVQLLLGPLGWAGADEMIDLAAAILTWRTIGFHPRLLPTFVIELLPVADMLPTWTGCVALVIAARKRQPSAQDRPAESQPAIDVKAERVE
jgi:hypothetical protein